MNIEHLQERLRHFAAERNWQPFHTPKNLVMALMVEAAELAEIFQWMTPEELSDAHADAAVKERIGAEIADVLLYLVQVADHTRVDLAQAIEAKLRRNAEKYPVKRPIAHESPRPPLQPDTHILLDFENVQPTDAELRAMVPEASRVWVFHGPHQKQIEKRFASFGTGMTPVPISKTGKNALDFHLSFYTGYIVSRNPNANIVVVANDKGYKPMLEHAKAMGFAVRQEGHARVVQHSIETLVEAVVTPAKAAPVIKIVEVRKGPVVTHVAKAVTAKQPATTKDAAKKAVAKKVAAKKPAAKKVAARKVQQPAAKKTTKMAAPAKASQPIAALTPKAVSSSEASASTLQKMTDSLRKMGDKRPAKQASVRRALKSFLGTATTDRSVALVLDELVASGVVVIDAGGVSYPQFRKKVGD